MCYERIKHTWVIMFRPGEAAMKKEIIPEFMWHLNNVILAYQIAIVTTLDSQGQVNAAPFGLTFPFCSSPENPQMLLCSNSVWHTSQNIEATGEFVINYAPYSLMEKAVNTGLMYPEGVNELEKAGLTPLPALKVNPPRIEECFQHIECTLNQIIRPSEYQNNFIGNISAISTNEDLVEKSQEAMMKAADPLFLFGIDVTKLQGNYARLGETTIYAPPTTDVD
jgi:flavin reductase (DIM6/NTAB) family NADH-FMN oxidoreductase RutF